MPARFRAWSATRTVRRTAACGGWTPGSAPVRATTADPALISARAAAAGVTGYTDATPGLSQDDPGWPVTPPGT